MFSLRCSRTMRLTIIIYFLAVAVLVSQSPATNFPKLTATDGTVYTGVTITGADSTGIRFSHDSGLASIPWAQVPADVQASLGYDPKKAAEATRQSAAAKAQQQAAAANDPAAKLSPAIARYKRDLERLIAQKDVSKISDVQAAARFINTSKQLVPMMGDHVQLIMAKWSQAAEQLSRSGLREAGIQRVFLKQFSQEDSLSNLQLVNGARAIKDQLANAQVPGSERATAALLAFFSSYASLCERDRTPSADPADFIRDIRTKYEFFAATLFVFADQSKAFTDQINAATPKKP